VAHGRSPLRSSALLLARPARAVAARAAVVALRDLSLAVPRRLLVLALESVRQNGATLLGLYPPRALRRLGR